MRNCGRFRAGGTRERDFVDKFIGDTVAIHYDSDALNSLRVTSQSESSYMKILKVKM
jgi:hypothetical protein